MERYLNDDLESAKKIRKTFAGLWGLEDLDIEKNFVFQVKKNLKLNCFKIF